MKAVTARTLSPTGGRAEIHLDAPDGPLLACLEVGKDAAWQVPKSKVAKALAGVHHLLVVTLRGIGRVELDWVSFE